jgi:pimeloyl-ACP methyl ester carboxylesterase
MMRAVFAAASLALTTPALAQQLDTGWITTAPGVSIYYEKYGSGAQAVLIPNRLFMPEMRELRGADRTLVLYDMRNRGKSGRVADSSRITIMHDVDDVEALRAHFGFQRMSLVGYSYLGLMVALYATEHPDRVERLVQIGPVPRQFGTSYPDDQTAGTSTLGAEAIAAWNGFRRIRDSTPNATPLDICRAQGRFFSFYLVGDPRHHAKVPDVCGYENELPEPSSRHLTLHFGDIQKRTFAREPFTKLTQPVLTIHGTMDRNASYGAGLEWATTFRDGRLITVEGGAHQVWLDDPSVVRDIDAFLRGSWPTRAQRFGRQ